MTYNKRHELRWRGFGLADCSHHHRGVSQLEKDKGAGYINVFIMYRSNSVQGPSMHGSVQ